METMDRKPWQRLLVAVAFGLAGSFVIPAAQTVISNNAADMTNHIVMVADSTTARTVTNLFTFNRGAAVPFAVGVSSLNVPNLDVDKLDGKDSTDFFWLDGSKTIIGDVKFTDATYDIGKSAATRPRDLFTSRVVNAGTTVTAGTGITSTTGNVTSTAGDIIATAGNWQGRAEFSAGNSGTAITINFTTNGALQKVTRNGNCTFTLSAPASPQTVILKFVHDGTATAYTVAFAGTGTPIKWPGGTVPTWTATASSIDILTLYWDGSQYFGVANAAFA